MTKEDLQACLKDPKLTVKELPVATIAAKTLTAGDHVRWESLLIRAIGHVPKPVELAGPDSGPMELIIKDYRESSNDSKKESVEVSKFVAEIADESSEE